MLIAKEACGGSRSRIRGGESRKGSEGKDKETKHQLRGGKKGTYKGILTAKGSEGVGVSVRRETRWIRRACEAKKTCSKRLCGESI